MPSRLLRPRDRPRSETRSARRPGRSNPGRLENIRDFHSSLGMAEPPKGRRFGPPHNPGLRELVAGKRRWSPPPKREDAVRGFRGWHERGYLPHQDAPGLIQFVTFHLVDSFPTAVRSEWAGL